MAPLCSQIRWVSERADFRVNESVDDAPAPGLRVSTACSIQGSTELLRELPYLVVFIAAMYETGAEIDSKRA